MDTGEIIKRVVQREHGKNVTREKKSEGWGDVQGAIPQVQTGTLPGVSAPGLSPRAQSLKACTFSGHRCNRQNWIALLDALADGARRAVKVQLGENLALIGGEHSARRFEFDARGPPLFETV